MKKNKKIYFVSDIHLKFVKDDAEINKRDKFINFLKSIENDALELFIVGDLFDFWFEWYQVIPKYWFDIFFQLKVLIHKEIKISFVSGNHDFYFDKYLQNEIGLQCYNEYTEVEFETPNGIKKFFIGHGDGYAKKDRSYRLLKRIIRNKISIFLFKTLIPIDLGVWLAKNISKISAKHRNDSQDWREEYYDFAKNKFEEGFDFVILGHLHKPTKKKFNEKVYINCGDWINSFSYAVYDYNEIELKYF